MAPTCRRPVSMNLGSESNDFAKGLDQMLPCQITRAVIKCHNTAVIEDHLCPQVKQQPGYLPVNAWSEVGCMCRVNLGGPPTGLRVEQAGWSHGLTLAFSVRIRVPQSQDPCRYLDRTDAGHGAQESRCIINPETEVT